MGRTVSEEAHGATFPPPKRILTSWILGIQRQHCSWEAPSLTGLIPAPLLTQSHELTSDSPAGLSEAGKWSSAHPLSQTAAGRGRSRVPVLFHLGATTAGACRAGLSGNHMDCPVALPFPYPAALGRACLVPSFPYLTAKASPTHETLPS